LLVRTHGQNNWRRRLIPDPRSRRRTNEEAGSLDAEGVRLVDGGELIPWSAFGGDAKVVDQLFLERLGRDYTSDELHGIEALVRIAAVLEAVQIAGELLDGPVRPKFDGDDADDLLAGFGTAAAWAAERSDDSALAREREAARRLADALLHASDGAWSSATAALEDLLESSRESLLVRLLSDGSGLHPELPAEPPPLEDEQRQPDDEQAAESDPAPAGDGEETAAEESR